MGRVCGSGCPYYGVDEDYNGYCKIDGNSYRERFSQKHEEGDGARHRPHKHTEDRRKI